MSDNQAAATPHPEAEMERLIKAAGHAFAYRSQIDNVRDSLGEAFEALLAAELKASMLRKSLPLRMQVGFSALAPAEIRHGIQNLVAKAEVQQREAVRLKDLIDTNLATLREQVGGR